MTCAELRNGHDGLRVPPRAEKVLNQEIESFLTGELRKFRTDMRNFGKIGIFISKSSLEWKS